MEAEIQKFLPDLPPGPLDPYRKNAKFNWKEMALLIEDPKAFYIKQSAWKEMENDPLFAHSSTTLPDNEHRRLTTMRIAKTKTWPIRNEIDLIDMNAFQTAVGQYDFSMEVKSWVTEEFFVNAIRGLGTDRHSEFMEACYNSELIGCVAVTEIAHGSNTKSLQTTATYEPETNSFILNTPRFQDSKCWIGGLAKTATHAIVYAQLCTPDGQRHGLHCFVVPIRNKMTMKPFAGVKIGDMGEKLGLCGLDNGTMKFDNYRIPKEALLNRNGDVNEKGEYVPRQKDPKKRFGASLGNLSAGRVGIMGIATANLLIALPIAIRYSAVRKQFGPAVTSSDFSRKGSTGADKAEEFAVIEYQLQQARLFPYLAATYLLKSFSDVLFKELMKFLGVQAAPQEGYDLPIAGQELHAITCSSKPLFTWTARDAIQECREACGGHGYLKASGLGRLRNDNDANVTYEGENSVLLQQTSNWLLKVWRKLKVNPNSYPEKTPLNTLSFRNGLKNFKGPLTKAEITVHNPKFILDTYKWLICYLLDEAEVRLKNQREAAIQAHGENELSKFVARNTSQAYYAKALSIAFAEHYVLERFYKRLFEGDPLWKDASIESRTVLTKLLLLYGLWSLDKHMMYLYQGGYATGPTFAHSVHNGILELCESLKMDAVPLADAIAPPDFVLNSVLGCADGEVYKRMETALSEAPGAFQRPDWWTLITEQIKSKL